MPATTNVPISVAVFEINKWEAGQIVIDPIEQTIRYRIRQWLTNKDGTETFIGTVSGLINTDGYLALFSTVISSEMLGAAIKRLIYAQAQADGLIPTEATIS